MKKAIVTAIIILTSTVIVAQREADAFYNRGCLGDPPCWCSPPVQGSVFIFNADSLQQIIDPACLPLRRVFSGAAFSDRHTGDCSLPAMAGG
jgi:hypothetical protein